MLVACLLESNGKQCSDEQKLCFPAAVLLRGYLLEIDRWVTSPAKWGGKEGWDKKQLQHFAGQVGKAFAH